MLGFLTLELVRDDSEAPMEKQSTPEINYIFMLYFGFDFFNIILNDK